VVPHLIRVFLIISSFCSAVYCLFDVSLCIGINHQIMLLDMKSSIMRHVTVTRILLIVVLGCAAMSVHLALQVKSGCICTNKNPQHVLSAYDYRLNTTFQSTYSATLRDAVHKLAVMNRDYPKDNLHRNVIETTRTSVADHPRLKSTTARMPSIHGQTSPVFQFPASVDSECVLPLFCSSNVVRNCITNDIIGHVPNDVRSQRIKSPRSRSVETSGMRQKSFKKVFDSRAWGHDWDLQHKGLNASGACQFLLLVLL